MVDVEELLDRFGDEEFLQELWLKTKVQLPEALAKIEGVLEKDPVERKEELGSLLHRLRGLVSNFLEGGESITTLRALEAANREAKIDSTMWQTFSAHLRAESKALESWLSSQGYPCS